MRNCKFTASTRLVVIISLSKLVFSTRSCRCGGYAAFEDEVDEAVEMKL